MAVTSVDCEVGCELEFKPDMFVVRGAVWELEFLADSSIDLTKPPSLEHTLGADWAYVKLKGLDGQGDRYGIHYK